MSLQKSIRQFTRIFDRERETLSPERQKIGAGVKSYMESFKSPTAMQCPSLRAEAVEVIDAFLQAR